MDDIFAPLTDVEIEDAANVATAAKDEDATIVMPVPSDAPPAPEHHTELGVPSFRWPYHDADGRVLFLVLRFDLGDGEKEFRPLSVWCDRFNQLKWEWKGPPAPRPLFNLDRLAANPDASVVVVEGEKSADGAALIFPSSVVTTSPNGSNSAQQADWSALAGRRVLIWADADAAGAKYSKAVASALDEIGCDVGIVDGVAIGKILPTGGARELPKPGWDAADAVEEWGDLSALRKTVVGMRKPFERGPEYVSHGVFEMTARGLSFEQQPNPKTGEAGTARVCAAFEIIGEARDPAGKGWAKVLRWKDPDKREHVVHVPVAAIHGEPAALASMLGADGLKIDRAQHKALSTYLNGASVKRRVTTVGRTGWHRIGDHDVFVLPSETIGPCGSEMVILDGAAIGPYESRGSLADWQDGVGALAADHALAVFAISAALAGPLLYLAGQEGGGINFYAQSSKGKTTLLQCSASVWGRGGSPGYVRAWRATANGLEGAAASASDTSLILDELGVIDAREAQSATYGLANGSGKSRAARDGSLREPKTWRVLTISSGELPIERKLAEAPGKRAMAGQIVRMLDIAADRSTGHGVFDHGGETGDAAAISKSMKAAAITNYGTAGPAFVRKLILEQVIGDDVRTLVADVVGSLVPAGSDGQIDRAAQRFALIAVAGEMAIQFGILPWKPGSAAAAAQWAFEQWVSGRGNTGSKEEQHAIEAVRLVIEKFGTSRFEALDGDGQRVVDRMGWTTGSGADRQWFIPTEVWRTEICSGLDPKFVAATLGKRRMLLHGGDGWQSVRRIEGGSKRVYVITTAIFEGSDDHAA